MGLQGASGPRRLFHGSIAAALGAGLLLVSVRAADLDTRVLQAVKAGHAADVQALLGEHADVNGREADGSTALLWAVSRTDARTAELLIRAGADVNLANRYGVTPLIESSRLGTTAITKALLAAGADVKTAMPDGETPLMAAAGVGDLEAVTLFLARGADVNVRERTENETALMWAAEAGHAGVVEALLAAGADPNLTARVSSLSRAKVGDQGRMWTDHATGGLTALMFAARQGHTAVINALAAKGADLNHRNPDSMTAMILAVLNDRLDGAEALLEKGADPNDGSLYEAVQLHNARVNDTAGEATRPRPAHENTVTPLDFISHLLDRGAIADKPAMHTMHFDGTGGAGAGGDATPIEQSAFARALQAQDVAALDLMLAKGADPNALVAGATPLDVAMGGGGGRGGFGGGFGTIPAAFRFASNRSPVAAVTALLDAGADVDGATPAGDTALHTAARLGNTAMIQLLADYGATLDVKDKAGLTPLDFAMGKLPPGLNAGRGRGGFPGRGGPPAGPQPKAIALLRELMGLPPLSPAEMPAPAGRGGRGRVGGN